MIELDTCTCRIGSKIGKIFILIHCFSFLLDEEHEPTTGVQASTPVSGKSTAKHLLTPSSKNVEPLPKRQVSSSRIPVPVQHGSSSTESKKDGQIKERWANQSSDILQHPQNRPTGDRWLKFQNTTIQIIKQNCKLDISK